MTIVNSVLVTTQWGRGQGNLTLTNTAGNPFSSMALHISGLRPDEVSYSYVNGDLLFTSPDGDVLTIENVPFVGNPFHIQYFELTGQWFGDNSAQTFEGVDNQSDYFAGNNGDDIYRWGSSSGNDTINNWEAGNSGFDVIEIIGLTASDITFTSDGRDLILTSPSGNTLTVLHHLTNANSFIDEVRFSDGTVLTKADIRELVTVSIDGTAADETLVGSDTRDILDGKGGDDLLIGLDGDDTYVWGLNSGSDTVQNWEAGHDGNDIVKVVGLVPADVQLIVEGRDLVMLSSTGESLRILNHVADSHSAINSIEFADGTVWDSQYIQSTASTTYVWGSGKGDIVLENPNGAGFSDHVLKIVGLSADQISYSHVNGALVFTSPTGDTLTIKDTSLVGNPFHIQYFELTGHWYGDNSTQTFEGVDNQSDYFAGNNGDDIYRWGSSSGNDTINNWEAGHDGNDIVKVVGLVPADVQLIVEGRDLVMLSSTGESLRILNHVADSHSAINSIEFADGTVWDSQYIQSTASTTYVWGSGKGDIVLENPNGTGFSDHVLKIVGLSADQISYSHVNGALVFTSPTGDTLTIKDTPLVGNPFHMQYFELTGHWYGDNSTQTFEGVDNQSDYFAGNNGDDIYRWGSSSGNDTINNWEAGNSGFDVIEIIGLTASDITFTNDGRDLILTSPSGNTLTVLHHLTNANSFIDEVRFSDGTVLTKADIRELVTVSIDGTAADETLVGSDTRDILDGKGGDDLLIGLDGDDTYVWGLNSGSDTVQNWEAGHDGNDIVKVVGLVPADVQLIVEGRDLVMLSSTGESLRILNHVADSHSAINSIEFADGTVWDSQYIQSTASTTYVWGSGQGDIVLENPNGVGFSDNVLKIVGLSADQISYSHVNGALVFTSPTGDTLTIKDTPLVGNPFHMQYFELTGHWYGDNSTQTFEGVDNQSDYFAGNNGDDIYRWGSSSGNDTINNWEAGNSGFDVIEIIGLTASDITFTSVGKDLILTSPSGNTLTVLHHLTNENSFIDEVRFSDGTVLTKADIRELVTVSIDGTAADETLVGSDTRDILDGKGGDDLLIGLDGDDTYVWGLNSGNDTINNWEVSNSGFDVIKIIGLTAADITFTSDGENLILTSPSGNTLTVLHHLTNANSFIDEIRFSDSTVLTKEAIRELVTVSIDGTAADETLLGSDTRDILDGKDGDDLLIGFGGDDTYIWGLNSGSDTVQNWEAGHDGNDIVKVVGIVPADVQLIVEGRDLVMLSSTGESLRILNHVADSHSAINSIEFADGTVWGQEYISENALHLQSGSMNNDVLIGESNPDLLIGKAGDDLLLGKSGNDVLEGNAGNDTLIGGSGNDLIIGGANDDIMFGRSIEGAIDLLEVNTFSWRESDKGDVGNPDVDVIADFRLGHDLINLKDLLVGENADNLDMYLNIYSSESDTYIEINSTGNLSTLRSEQIIKLQNVDLSGSAYNLEALYSSIIIDE